MDDICDSGSIIAGAEQLTNDIDKVLAKGGFQVKGWRSNEVVRNHGTDKCQT